MKKLLLFAKAMCLIGIANAQFFIDNGNVGVGTTTPAYNLDVNGTFNANQLFLDGEPLAPGGGYWMFNDPNIYFNTGNVGIGTDSPAEALDIKGNLAVSGKVIGTQFTIDMDVGTHPKRITSSKVGGGASMEFQTYNALNSALQTRMLFKGNSGNDIEFYDKDQNQFVHFDGDAGNIGIGTTTPHERLEVSGAIRLSNLEISYLQSADNLVEGVIFYDRNFSGAGESGDGFFAGDGGGLSVYNEDNGWSALLDTKNMAFLKARFNSVGIGTSNPVEKLDVRGNAYVSGNTYVSGNVGIGTTTPHERLEVSGAIRLPNMEIPHLQSTDSLVEGVIFYDRNFSGAGESGDGFFAGDGGGLSVYNEDNGWSALLDTKNMAFLKAQFKELDVRGNTYVSGNVGIGTTNPGAWKLAVNGKVRAKEVKVETGWSDFVFEEDYALPTLEEVESHIAEKGHLKDIPSAEEVEANGIFVGEMNAKLLQKIEELTLYMIEQNKQNQAQQAEIETLKTMNIRLSEKIQNLENH